MWLPWCATERWFGCPMPKNRPRCHCGGDMKRNGTTSNGTTRWRCKICGASLTKQRSDITNAALFRAFIQHLTAGTSLAAIAGNMSCSTRTLQRKFD
ncbi:TPA: IS256 family transposase, partial [Corynebacterium striatum]|nr:IS256 family transposase [Corynebacterium striatum]HAT1177514.1 IS256 family transposase [Corynebacterium striatum]HAT1329630.1 IS256 family transposase [Corynebacterium striatum]HAT1332096.1 IS256 family transposase [Corynebacterium striatum]HAT1367545.1 IS256 family transposase [Corynebacterium striatum]